MSHDSACDATWVADRVRYLFDATDRGVIHPSADVVEEPRRRANSETNLRAAAVRRLERAIHTRSRGRRASSSATATTGDVVAEYAASWNGSCTLAFNLRVLLRVLTQWIVELALHVCVPQVAGGSLL